MHASSFAGIRLNTTERRPERILDGSWFRGEQDPGSQIFLVKVGTVIRTTYADTELIRKHLPSLRGQPDEDRLLRAAAILDDLGITVTDTQAEANEIREKIPGHLLYASKEVGGWHLFVHARVEALPLRERW